MIKTTMSIVTIAVLGMSGLSAETVSISDTAKEADSKKDIVVVATAPAPVVNTPVAAVETYADTIISTKGVKNHYTVGEEIKIKFALKRDAYIYFWTLSHTGKGYLILPNDFNVVKQYKSKKEIVVPEASAKYQFSSDREGVEEVFVLATSKPLNPNSIKEIFSDMSGGVVPTASKGKVAKFLSKDIVVLAKQEKFEYDVESFLVQIHEKKPEAAIPVENSYSSSPVVNVYINNKK